MPTPQTPSELRYANDPTPEQAKKGEKAIALSPINLRLPIEKRGQEVLRLAEEAFAKTGSWVVFYREMLGVDGVVRKLFPETDQLRFFETRPEFAELQEMVAAMRSQDPSKGDSAEPERMITIRLPRSLHEALQRESDELNLSINQLCISKLLQRIESRFIPIQRGRRRGRRPGPQGKRNPETRSDAAPPAESHHDRNGTPDPS